MAGKRYSEKEIARIVELKNSGKTFEEIADAIKGELNIVRPVSALKVIYDRNQAKG